MAGRCACSFHERDYRMEPKMKIPRLVSELYKQIEAHPDFGRDLRVALYMNSVRSAPPQCARDNNKWARRMWRHLYLGHQAPPLVTRSV